MPMATKCRIAVRYTRSVKLGSTLVIPLRGENPSEVMGTVNCTAKRKPTVQLN